MINYLTGTVEVFDNTFLIDQAVSQHTLCIYKRPLYLGVFKRKDGDARFSYELIAVVVGASCHSLFVT